MGYMIQVLSHNSEGYCFITSIRVSTFRKKNKLLKLCIEITGNGWLSYDYSRNYEQGMP